uniref:Amastin n=1 Tax=Strongyloides venezuelensis TaxID=75913 RepID=A0A0K0G2G7_STRVS
MMTSLWMFWKTLIAFTILFVCQTVFITYFWSNTWFVADNIKGYGPITYTISFGFNSYCIKSEHNIKPHCISSSDKGEFFEDYGVQLSIEKELLTSLRVSKFIYILIIVSQLFMAIGIIGRCKYIDSNQISVSDVLFASSSIVDVILKFALSNFLILGYNREIGATIYGNKIYSSFGLTIVLFAISLIMTVVVNILMLGSFVKTAEKSSCQRGKKYFTII